MLRVITDVAAKWIQAIRRHSFLLKRPWMLPVGVVALIAAHLIVLCYALPHVALPVAVVSGVILVVMIKHVGLLGTRGRDE
jgi:hypothetical protein